MNSQPGWLYEGNAVLHPRGSEYQTQLVVDGIPLTDNRSPSHGPELEADDVLVRFAAAPGRTASDGSSTNSPFAEALAKRLPERPDKVAFSGCAVPSVVETFRRAARPKVVLAGIETHVCVQGTALDLLALGFQVYVPVDAVGSRYAVDHDTALRRLEKAGAVLTTSETCVFEWVGGAGHPQFKAVSGLVQERMKALSS